MKRNLLTLGLAFGLCTANAQITLVHSFCTGSSYGSILLTPFNGKLYMGADDCVNGRELYVYDGVSAPSLVYNLNPGLATGMGLTLNRRMGVLGSKLYFYGNNGSSGGDLFSYDGTNPPMLEQDIYAGSGTSAPANFFTLGTKLFFAASTGAKGTELYSYDGSALTLFDINPGTNSSNPDYFTAYQNKLYFTADDGVHGAELFSYNPSTNSFTMVSDIHAGSAGSYPAYLKVVGNKLYFAAQDGTHGYELYVYNGSTVTRLTDVAPGNLFGVNEVGVYKGDIYFSGSTDGSTCQFYHYDTTTNTVALVYNIYPGGSGNPQLFTEYAGKLYFMATDASHGRELWSFDGATTSLVMDLTPGSTYGIIGELTVWNNALYLSGNNGSSGAALFRLEVETGVAGTTSAAAVKAFPVPATDKCTLEITLGTPAVVNVVLTDISGNAVYRTSCGNLSAGLNEVILPMSGLSTGLYFYHLCDDFGHTLQVGKIVKE